MKKYAKTILHNQNYVMKKVQIVETVSKNILVKKYKNSAK